MNAILVKLFATALAFSQVAIQPDAIKTQFDAAADKDAVVQLLRGGCAHMRKAFDIENLNLDDLIATAMDDPDILSGAPASFRGIDFTDLHAAYRQFCKNETPSRQVVDIGAVITFYNAAAVDLPDHSKLKAMNLPGMSTVLDGKGKVFAEVFEPRNRRVWVALSDVPKHVQNAFVAAEDKRFYQHRGIDERGLVRAFIGNLLQSGRLQGGSTITQQIAKNLLVGNDVTYQRKIREIIVASRIEQTLSKAEILALYLNSVYLGRGSWGIEMAARGYFGKPAKELTLAEGALLAGLAKGPGFFNPDRHPKRAHDRLAYVLSRMQEDGAASAKAAKAALAAGPKLTAYTRTRRDSGFHFVDQIAREARTRAAIKSLTASSYTVRSTVHPALQEAVEAALQDGLAGYERKTGRRKFSGPEANLAKTIARVEERAKDDAVPAWQLALMHARLPLYDVHWEPAIVLENGRGKNVRVGLGDGRVLPLRVWSSAAKRALNRYDVVYVRTTAAKGKAGAHAVLRARPQVQGAALVLENNTGRILAMAGSFSYPLSQLNRVSQTRRQPGSAFKPLVYLAALRSGLQPNTLVYDTPITLAPIGDLQYARDRDYWTPQNYGGASSGVLTLRRGLERSRNLVTAHLLQGGIEFDEQSSLDKVCELAVAARLYKKCQRYYPVILGAQGVRLIDLAAFYAAIANEGRLPQPHAIDSIERGGEVIYRAPTPVTAPIATIDAAMMYQLKSMLQGVVARGTAVSIKQLAPFVAGKTGTSDEENDAWFVGFTNKVTVAVWVGYDNPGKTRRTLGHGQTGAKVALPIFHSIVASVWGDYAARTALSPPSPEAQRRLVALPIDLHSGARVDDNSRNKFIEYFRRNSTGELAETRHNLVTAAEASYLGDSELNDPYNTFASGPAFPDSIPLRRPPSWRVPSRPPARGLFGRPPWWDDEESAVRRPRRFDPDFFWGNR